MTGDNTGADDVEYWLSPSTGSTTKHRALHVSRDCRSFSNSNPRPATDREIDELDECQHCAGTAPDPGDPDLSYQEALKAAAEANRGDEQ